MDFITSFLSSDVRTAMPILIAALGLVYSERAGVVNIGAEGIMFIGALASFTGSYYTGNAWAGMGIAVLTGLLIGLAFAFLVVTVKANQTVVGAALNIFGSGLSITLNRVIFGISGTPHAVDVFKNVPIPVLSKIPVLGDILFNHNIWVYIIVAGVFVANYVLFKTEMGLRIRAVGENPKACDTLGISVPRIRYGTILFSTAMCGLAGGYMSIAQLNFFIEGMVSGRGYIALAARRIRQVESVGRTDGGAGIRRRRGGAIQTCRHADGHPHAVHADDPVYPDHTCADRPGRQDAGSRRKRQALYQGIVRRFSS
jgi:simple sugar transport system permease protein